MKLIYLTYITKTGNKITGTFIKSEIGSKTFFRQISIGDILTKENKVINEEEINLETAKTNLIFD